MNDKRKSRGPFDQFAERSAELVSRTPFFIFCVALVIVWLPTYPMVGNFDTWQLLINTPTTILTFLLVAVLQNSQRRTEEAMHEKLNALADGLADLMEHFTGEDSDDVRTEDLLQDVKELKEAVGLEDKI